MAAKPAFTQSQLSALMNSLGERARASAQTMATASSADKDKALITAADLIEAHAEPILSANSADLLAAEDIDAALKDRLELTPARIVAMADGLRQVAGLVDPIGEISDLNRRPSGIQVGTMRVPLGVIGIIYESRPNVTADAAALCLKSGNAVILRGGSEALRSNQAIAKCLSSALLTAGLPAAAVQLVPTTDRAAVGEMLRMQQYIDVIVPRGGKSLIERVSAETRIPVIKHLDGVCHVYIDAAADLDKAIAVAFNSKTHRYGVCNAMETLLLARPIAAEVVQRLLPMYREKGVELRGCEETRALDPAVLPATEDDWYAEYLAPILAVRVVDDVDAAMAHIRRYGSQHTDCIMTEDQARATRFLNEVDSSSVLINASTRFADGYEYGLGAEIGISTDKLHARGPVGLEGLTSKKYVVFGDGEVRQ